SLSSLPPPGLQYGGSPLGPPGPGVRGSGSHSVKALVSGVRSTSSLSTNGNATWPTIHGTISTLFASTKGSERMTSTDGTVTLNSPSPTSVCTAPRTARSGSQPTPSRKPSKIAHRSSAPSAQYVV